jgi:hypothetical protein
MFHPQRHADGDTARADGVGRAMAARFRATVAAKPSTWQPQTLQNNLTQVTYTFDYA